MTAHRSTRPPAGTYAFETPRWRPLRSLVSYTVGALLAAAGWLLLFAWLGYRLWAERRPVLEPLHLVLAAVLVTSGVVLGLVLWELGKRWLRQLWPAAWRALSLEQMLALSPAEFEEYVAQRLFARQGYRVLNTPNVKDGGVDILLTDRRGEQAVVQCKRYRGSVGEATVRDLYGTMMHSGAAQAFLVTTGSISAEARRWAAGKPIHLIDGARLVELARSLPHSPQ